jgi:hypothetical protein
MTLTRRSFAAWALQPLLLASLLQHSARADALRGTIKSSSRPWLRRLEDVSAALSKGGVSPTAWQREVENTLGAVDLPDFLRSLDFETLAAGARFPSQGEGMERLYFPDDAGKLQPLAFRPYLFTLARGTAVVPHGHHNMVTMHMLLSGSARLRQFDKLEASASHMTIRPVADVLADPGAVSSISDEQHNVHWFDALSDRVFMFNIAVYQIGPGPFGDRDYVDPLAGAASADGTLRAPRLTRAEAYAKYGHDHAG